MRPLDCEECIRIYNFTNLVEIRTISKLKQDGVSIQKIHKSLGYLRFRYADIKKPLSQMTPISDENGIFVLSELTFIDSLRNGQVMSRVVFKDVIQELKGKRMSIAPADRAMDFTRLEQTG